jgi:hypothetical protein
MQSTNIDEISSVPYDVIQDKALPTQDHLYKLIIIGDTGKNLRIDYSQVSEKAAFLQELWTTSSSSSTRLQLVWNSDRL